MKLSHILAAALLLAATLSAHAGITVLDSSYTVSAYYTHSTSDSIVSFDWDASGTLYYVASDSGSTFTGFYKASKGATSTVAAGSSDWAGASVVAAGSSVYYNTSDLSNQKIYQYGPLGGAATVSLASTAPNYGLYKSASYANALFITGAVNWGNNHLYYAPLSASGGLLSIVDLGETIGASGPIAFDKAGNLYYSPGYSYDGNLAIYRWSAAQIAAAIADPTTNALSITGALWVDYTALYNAGGAFSGATSMVVDTQGDLLVTLTSFTSSSELVKFGVSNTGSYDGTTSGILSTTDRLGELRLENNTLYLADGNQIYEVVPEPSSWALIGTGLLFAAGVALRRRSLAATPASR